MFTREYDVTTDGGPVTVLTGGRRESCVFDLDGVEHRITREARRRFVLHGPAGRLAVAEMESGRRWRVSAQTGNVQLVRPSLWRSTWELHQRGSARGTFRPEGAFRRTVVAQLPTDLPLPVALFAFYVVLMIYQRQAAAAAAGSG